MKHALWCLLPVAVLAARLPADCGSIAFDSGPKLLLFEPNQRALIVWNGTEEILVLSTDLRASKPTKVLEVIPLPGKPRVKNADTRIFDRATKLINEKIPPVWVSGGHAGSLGGDGGGGTGPAKPEPAAKVEMHEKIGATDVSVVHVQRPEGFIEWVEKYLKKQDVKSPRIPKPLKKVVAEYLKEDFTWFAFNVVSLSTKTKTKQAIEYRFPTPYLYYPLRITKTETGSTSVKLLILTKELLHKSKFRGVPLRSIVRPHRPIDLTGSEIRWIHSPAFSLLGGPTKAKLRTWVLTGELPSFKQDILVGDRPLFYLRSKGPGNATLGPYMLRQGYRCQIGTDSFMVRRGTDQKHFQLLHEQDGSRYGPFEFTHGKTIRVRDQAYLLLREDSDASMEEKDPATD